ncbi:transglutaminase-like domain-containing protein [Spongiivirga citrea]|uniref:Transglutaminase n=1 Tax=Spongiivirga citrea TaxID=1481457 RepID=A0A6M0CLZ3_9FLAO|nr:transglutaminase-like domain-containing protein [Spongiivirga citrea]NER16467.1 transglutaminase [Spongiivirga citrea]
MEQYIQPTFYIDSDNDDIQNYTQRVTNGITDTVEQVKSLFTAVRDDFYYNPYELDLSPSGMKASAVLNKKTAYCIEKAVLLAAVLRAKNIPAKLHFGNVRNHIAVGKFVELTKSDLMVFHGCTVVWLNNKWIKLTPAFNKELCKKLNVGVLDFDGENDAVFQQFSKDGSKFMVYEHEYGEFNDLPYEMMLGEFSKYYGHLWDGSSHKILIQ